LRLLRGESLDAVSRESQVPAHELEGWKRVFTFQLHAQVQALTHELARLRGDGVAAAQHQLEFLKELLAQRERALFAPSSEQRPRPAASTSPAAPTPRQGHGPKAQLALPRVEMVHVLDEADQTCPQCGGTLRPMAGQTEDAEEITVVERRFVLVTRKRQKYRCACNGCVFRPS
jgi:hypothetical protein